MTSVPHPMVVPPVPVTPTGPARWYAAGSSVVAAGLLVLTAAAGAPVVGVLVVVAVLAWGWPSLLALPTPRGTTALVALGGTLAALAVALPGGEPRLRWLGPAVAGAVVAEFVHQLARRDGRPRLVESVSATIAAVALLGSVAATVALPSTGSGTSGVAIWAGATGLALAVQGADLPPRWLLAGGVVVGALAGALLGALLPAGTAVTGFVVGLVVSAVALLLHRVLATLPAAGRAPGWLALGVASLAAPGAAAYVLLRLLVG
jgi:hypothetical protein